MLYIELLKRSNPFHANLSIVEGAHILARSPAKDGGISAW